MRLISQDENIELTYERVVLTQTHGKKHTLNAIVGETSYKIATYNRKTDLDKALDCLHNTYQLERHVYYFKMPTQTDVDLWREEIRETEEEFATETE